MITRRELLQDWPQGKTPLDDCHPSIHRASERANEGGEKKRDPLYSIQFRLAARSIIVVVVVIDRSFDPFNTILRDREARCSVSAQVSL